MKNSLVDTALGQAALVFRGRKGMVEVLDNADDGEESLVTGEEPQALLVQPRQSTVKVVLAKGVAKTIGVVPTDKVPAAVPALAQIGQPFHKRRG